MTVIRQLVREEPYAWRLAQFTGLCLFVTLVALMIGSFVGF